MAKTVTAIVAGTLILGNVFLNFFVNLGLNRLIAMITCFNVLAHITLINVDVPVSAQNFYQTLF